MKSNIYSISEVTKLIESGKTLIISGEEHLLSALPQGRWIGGTIPYFYVDGQGGVFSQEQIFVTDLSDIATEIYASDISEANIGTLLDNSFVNGFTFLILPAFQPIHLQFALQAPNIQKLYDNPLIGIVAGVSLEDLQKNKLAKVFNGLTNQSCNTNGVYMHINLPAEKVARLEIINIFTQKEKSDSIEFTETAFRQRECLINGVKTNLSQYIKDKNINTQFPLVSNYSGAMINVSFHQITDDGEVVFYAPVFKGKEYKVAEPMLNYVSEFTKAIPNTLNKTDIVYTCNCILNFLYGDLQGKDIGFSGAATFGEIAYVLINQTFTYLVIDY
jgi:hypothetical protein